MEHEQNTKAIQGSGSGERFQEPDQIFSVRKQKMEKFAEILKRWRENQYLQSIYLMPQGTMMQKFGLIRWI